VKPQFIIYALPRSRTYWLSRFLTYGDWSCGHDELRHARGMDDLESWFAQPCVGTVETAGAPWWRLVQAMAPGIRSVVIRREPEDVVASLMRMGIAFDLPRLRAMIYRLDRKLTQIERRVSGVLSVPFADLDSRAGCARIFEHCLPYQFDDRWWEHARLVNLQINLPHLFRYYRAYETQLARLAGIAKLRVVREMQRRVLPDLSDGVVIAEEPFDIVYRDGTRLFAEHMALVGEAPDAFSRKNIALMQRLYNAGSLQIVTARCNGRIFGYLMTVLSPSLESPDMTSATQTTFFVSREIPGLGIKLHRASLERLERRGVDEVLMRAGIRGSGPRMGALYRRLGAQECGQDYLLKLKAAA
jgi:hypothetical protein